jgi:hypothetical protein
MMQRHLPVALGMTAGKLWSVRAMTSLSPLCPPHPLTRGCPPPLQDVVASWAGRAKHVRGVEAERGDAKVGRVLPIHPTFNPIVPFIVETTTVLVRFLAMSDPTNGGRTSLLQFIFYDFIVSITRSGISLSWYLIFGK